MTSSSNSSQSTHPTGQVLWEELLVLSRFHRNYKRPSGIFVPCGVKWHIIIIFICAHLSKDLMKEKVQNIQKKL